MPPMGICKMIDYANTLGLRALGAIECTRREMVECGLLVAEVTDGS